MATFPRTFNSALMIVLLTLGGGLAGCDDDGPFEEAGEEIDEAGEDAQRELEELEDEAD